MYIKITKNNAGQAYYHLVESYREKGKARQRTLLSLGKVGEDRLDALVSAISRHKEVMGIVDIAKSISVADTFIYGPLVILEKLFERYGIDKILEEIVEAHPKLTIDIRKIIFTLVACRFIKPSSKLKVFEHWQTKLYPEMISRKIELHQIYRVIDILSKHKEKIENNLYWQDRDLFTMEVDIVLYDLTTLRFESVREDTGNLRRFGYSKEMRSDCTQVVLGLLVDTQGIPLGFEVYPGNTFEGKTLEDIVKKMRNKFRVRRFIFVADRGLFSAKNLESIRGVEAADPGEFIVGMKLGIFKDRHDEFYDKSRYTYVNKELAIYETTYGEDRCIITWSKAREKRDQKVREDILAKIRKKLAGKHVSSKRFVSNRNYQKYLTGLGKGDRPIINEEAITNEGKRDGYFGVLTNVKDMSASDIVKNYKNLWIIEDAFGEMKGTLKARPIFHWTDRRIIGHLTLCFLAYFCEAQMTKLLREQGKILTSEAIEDETIQKRPLTVVEAMKELSEVRAIPVEIRSKKIWVRTDIQGNAAKLFLAAGVKIPPKVLNLEKNENVVAQTKTASVTY